jgi:hypothetical protein
VLKVAQQSGAAATDFHQETYKMTRNAVRFALLVLALTVSITAFARSKSENISLFQDVTVNGTTVPAGDYVVKYDIEGSNAQVKFTKNGKEIASANGQVKTLTKKPDRNQVQLSSAGDTHTISEIDFGGKDTAITFEGAGAAAGK